MKNKKFVFVLMPFDKSFDDIYRLGIKETVTALNKDIVVERLDEQMFSEGMLNRIYNQIEKADLIVSDMTGKNSNVFYEVGYAHAKDKLVLLITKDANDIPFDLKHFRHIVYGESIVELKNKLKDNILWAFKEIENKNKLPVEIDLEASGYLDKTDYSATADIELKINFTNISKSKAINLDAVYLYTQKGWEYKQNRTVCPQAKSDLTHYHVKHQIVPQITKISHGNWTQISLTGTRTLANTFKGDILKEKYILQGVVNIRIVSNEDSLDYEKSLNLIVEDIPF